LGLFRILPLLAPLVMVPPFMNRPQSHGTSNSTDNTQGALVAKQIPEQGFCTHAPSFAWPGILSWPPLSAESFSHSAAMRMGILDQKAPEGVLGPAVMVARIAGEGVVATEGHPEESRPRSSSS